MPEPERPRGDDRRDQGVPLTGAPPPGEDAVEDFGEVADDLYENASVGYLTTRPDGTIVKVNRTFLAWTGFRREQLVGQRRFPDLLTAGGRIYHETHYAPLLALQGAVSEIALEIRCADRSRLPVFVNSVVEHDDEQPRLIRTTIFNATDRQRYERELLHARDRARAARERAERLQRVTAALARRLSPVEIGEALRSELVSFAGVDAAEIVLLDDIGSTIATVGSREADGAVRQIAALELRVEDRGFGTISLFAQTGAPLVGDDRAVVVACALQAAQALDRAALLRQEADIARVLQRSLRHAVPIDDARIRLGSHYQPAVSMLEVGGDWHDAFPLSDGRLGLVVGDVVGRGIQAATAMGQLRSAARALAIADLGGPERVLAALDRFVSGLPLARMATLVYAEIEIDGGEVRYACAGHPPPVRVPADGEPTLLWDGRRPPLGVPDTAAPEGRTTLGRGDRLLLYTDGLVERRDETLDDGLARLLHAIGTCAGHEAQTQLDEVVGILTAGRSTDDDACALCLELG